MAQKPSIPKGTRDFGPSEMAGRNYIFNTIKAVFRKYGYQAIETPSLENLSTLLGKYGEEGDKLLFRIQNSGEKAALPPEKGLRYDLTVPFARFVVQHQNEISFPFKRYQIQPVWRADRPQKGRYREFYQCDVDVIGSKSLLNELELVQIVDDVFGRMGVRVTVPPLAAVTPNATPSYKTRQKSTPSQALMLKILTLSSSTKPPSAKSPANSSINS